MVLLPLLLLGCLELILRLTAYGYPTSFLLRRDFNGQPVFIENQKFGWRFFGPALARTPRPLLIPAVKPPNTCRIFVFGESAAYGDPRPEFGLPRMLEALLHERFPQTNFQVINAAMTGINSHTILPIARDCAGQSGDIWVIYMGNNEVVGPFGAGTVFGPQAPPLWLARADLQIKATRLGQLFESFLSHARNSHSKLAQWGMSLFVGHHLRHDDPRLETVYANFTRNLADLIHVGRAHGTGIVLSTIVSNLRDCPPFGSQHRIGLTQQELQRWNQLYAAGTLAEQAGKFAEAVPHFAQAASIDDQFAELQFRWGRCCLALGQTQDARRHFTLACDYDTLRFRADSRINAIIRAAATASGQNRVLLADSERVMASASADELPGNEFLLEHVHFNFEGNYRLARAIADQVVQLLPHTMTSRAQPQWASSTECARRLAWTDWDRYKTLKLILLRLNEAPFTYQLDYAEHRQRLQHDLEGLLPTLNPPGMKQISQQYRDALTLSPQDWALERSFAELQIKLGDNASAEASCRRVIELLPFDSMAYVELGSLLIQSSRAEAAVEQFHKALELDPQSIPALNGLALTCVRQQKMQEAIALFHKALQLQPNSADTHLNLGTALEATDQKEEARAEFRLALEADRNTPETLVRLGKTALSHAWVLEAIANFNRAAELNPTDAAVHYYLGGAFDTAGRTAEAKQQFAEAARLNPDHAGAHLGLGVTLAKQGQDTEALQQFAEAARLDPRMLDARLYFGIALLKQHNTADARREFEAVLQLDPKNVTAHKYLQSIP